MDCDLLSEIVLRIKLGSRCGNILKSIDYLKIVDSLSKYRGCF